MLVSQASEQIVSEPVAFNIAITHGKKGHHFSPNS